MFGSGRLFVAGLAVGAVALFAGCQDTGGHADHADHAALSDKAVMCSKCQVTYFQDSLGKGSPVKYQTSKMECPDCKSAAENFFATGKAVHDCKTCGPDALKVCELHR
jgi:hypothetical protein